MIIAPNWPRAAIAALVLAMAGTGPAYAQDTSQVDAELPTIDVEVTSPTPVVKKKRKTANTVQTAPASEVQQAPDLEARQEPLPGTLIVVDDAFVPLTVVTSRDIENSTGVNIADSLDTRPGIIGSTFSAASNRPIIRGLDNYRVRVQENGIGTHDVSALSEDHAVPVAPFTADRVEVIRGPATLRYGSQAIGGVVSVENGRIPTYIPRNGFSGEVKGGWSSADEGRDGALRATAGANGVAVYADAFKRKSEDYDTPRGEQFNTFADTEGGAVGTSLIGSDGYVGVSVSRYESLYGIPGEEAPELRPRIDLVQDRFQAKGEWNINSLAIETLRFWFGASDYAHNELVDEDGEIGEVGSRFTNEEYEGRAELQHAPFATSLGKLSGAVGISFVDRSTRGQSFEGDSLLAPAETESIAGFWFEELALSRQLTFQAAARIEHTDVEGSGRLDPLNANVPLTRQNRSFTPSSGSLGFIYGLPSDIKLSLTGQYVERAPDAAELFSAGIHEATGTFEIGNPNLEKERAKTIELGLRKATGPFRFDTTAFYTRFNGFIFKSLTGVECDGTLESCGEEEDHGDEDGHGHEALDQVLFQQRNATFYGVEVAGQYDVARIWNGVWGIEGQYDFVRARLDGGENVPRIPPHRLGGGLFYRDNNFFARAGILHAFEQDEFGEGEFATPDYTLVSAELSYTTQLSNAASFTAREFTIGIKGENLADDVVLNHASFKRREDVLLPGASVRLFGSLKLN